MAYQRDIRLNTAQSVNKLLARVIKMLMNDEIDESKSRTIGYLANIMLKGFEVTEQEKQIEDLIAKVEEIRGK